MDTITLNRIATAHPDLRKSLYEIYNEICDTLTNQYVKCRFAYVLRTFEEQNGLYAIGRTKPGRKVTNAKGGDSFHNYGLAVDIVLLIDKDKNGTWETASWDMLSDFDGDLVPDWMEIVKIFKKYGWAWGGDFKSFKDYPHFQKTFGLTLKEVKKRYAENKFIGEKHYIWIT